MEVEWEESTGGVTIAAAVGEAADVKGAAVDVDVFLHTGTARLKFSFRFLNLFRLCATSTLSRSEPLPREIFVTSLRCLSPWSSPLQTPGCLLWRVLYNTA